MAVVALSALPAPANSRDAPPLLFAPSLLFAPPLPFAPPLLFTPLLLFAPLQPLFLLLNSILLLSLLTPHPLPLLFLIFSLPPYLHSFPTSTGFFCFEPGWPRPSVSHQALMPVTHAAWAHVFSLVALLGFDTRWIWIVGTSFAS